MRQHFLATILALILLLLCNCTADTPQSTSTDSTIIEKTVVVVLPMEEGLDLHWQRILTLLDHNIATAFSLESTKVKLNIEWHDESSEDLLALAGTLATRDDIYAVIGGLYSHNAKALATPLCRAGVTFMTLATTEELVRGYASSGNLWALTETDITQSEVLLSKVVNYGGESVALIADGSDPYGKTFVDWFAFQAQELGLTVKGIYNYAGSDVGAIAGEAACSGADYVICAPTRTEDLTFIVKAFHTARHAVPRLLFSDIAYGTDVISRLGALAEGIEGVCFGANPESGFDVSYRTFFGEAPTVGAAQLYDAAMLLVYAAWYQHLYPGTSLRDSLRAIVDGRDFNMGSWMGEDIRNVISALSHGESPYVRGASGSLDFDSHVYTNVLSTVYYNYKVYDGNYIILDYNTADGGNRTDATLAGWNWKASSMQNFDQSPNIAYGQLTGRKALLVAASSTWSNYRHQADTLAMYRLLKSHGYTDDDIILIMADDIADNMENPEKGNVRISPGGINLYDGIVIDYNLKDLSAEDICNLISGESTSNVPFALDSDPGTNLLIFWSGHGLPGELCWDDADQGISALRLRRALSALYERKGYRKLAMFVEACYSGSVIEPCVGLPGMIFFTAANPDETSKADMYSSELGVWMSNRFTSTLLESLNNNSAISMHDLYNRLFINTVGSHVMVYNHEQYGNLYIYSMDEFINP